MTNDQQEQLRPELKAASGWLRDKARENETLAKAVDKKCPTDVVAAVKAVGGEREFFDVIQPIVVITDPDETSDRRHRKATHTVLDFMHADREAYVEGLVNA